MLKLNLQLKFMIEIGKDLLSIVECNIKELTPLSPKYFKCARISSIKVEQILLISAMNFGSPPYKASLESTKKEKA